MKTYTNSNAKELRLALATWRTFNGNSPIKAVVRMFDGNNYGKTEPIEGILIDTSDGDMYFHSNEKHYDGSCGPITAPSKHGFKYSYVGNYDSGFDFDLYIKDPLPQEEDPKFVVIRGNEAGLMKSLDPIKEDYIVNFADYKIFELGREIKPEVKITFS